MHFKRKSPSSCLELYSYHTRLNVIIIVDNSMKRDTLKFMKNRTLRHIAELGNPILREKSVPIIRITHQNTQKLINDMIATVLEVDGVGIAASQVHLALQLCIIASKPNPRYPNAPLMRPTTIINPYIISHSTEIVHDWEGCLSIPGIRGYVPRYSEITTSFVTRTGRKITKTFRGFIARIFQHEFDHIQGLVYLDKLDNTKDIISDKEYQKLIRKQILNGLISK